jgi:CRP-like cAMP-binding protein/uncharacterized membrane protein YdbT with pleckstrin-like domain
MTTGVEPNETDRSRRPPTSFVPAYTDAGESAPPSVDQLWEALPAVQKFPRQDVFYILNDAIDNDFDATRRILYSQGDPVERLFLIIEGEVEEKRTTRQGDRQRTSLHRKVGRGTLLGLYDLFYRKEHSTRAKLLSGATVIPLRAVAIDRLIYRFPELREALAPLKVIERLRTIPFLSCLHSVGLGFVADAAARVEWPADHDIYRAGESADYLYFIDRGQVHLQQAGVPEYWLGNGAAFGFCEQEGDAAVSYTHDAVTTTPTTVFRIARAALAQIIDTNLDYLGRSQRRMVVETLAALPLFADFPPEQRTMLPGFVSHYHIPINHLVIQQGELNDSLWILLPQHEARLHALDRDGQALQSTGVTGPAYFGEIALRLEMPADSTVEAEANSHWLRLHVGDLDALSLLTKVDLRRKLQLRNHATALMSGLEQRRQYGWLQPGEFIVDARRRHWIVLLRMTWPAQLLFWLIFLPGSLFSIFSGAAGWATWLLLLVGLTLVGQLAWGVLDYLNDYLIVTNRRVVRQEEVILLKQWRQEASLEQIQNVDVATDFWGNLFGYGNLVVHTAGTAGSIAFDIVGNAERVRTAIFDQRSRRQGHVLAEGKGVIQRMLEGRLGLRLHLPERVYQTVPSRTELWDERWWHRLLPQFDDSKPERQRNINHIVWRKHWFVLATQIMVPLLLFVGILLLFFGQIFAWIGALHSAFLALDLLLALLGLADVAWIAWIVADWRNDTYEVNTEILIDVEKKPLFFSESRRQARLGDIENIEVSVPTPLHYILDFGDVRLQTAAQQGTFTFDLVPDPRGVAAEIQRRIGEFRRRQELDRARLRAQELPDWFELYDRLDDSQKRAMTSDAEETG